MANAYTDTSAVANLIQAAFDKYGEMALRSEPLFRQAVSKHPEQPTGPGSSVTFEIFQDLSAATSTLSEDVDPDAVALPNTTTVSVTVNEYGNPVLLSRKLRLLSLTNIDPVAANQVAFNMADSVDSLVQTTLRGGTNVARVNATVLDYNTGSTGAVAAGDIFRSAISRLAVAKLRANLAVPMQDGLYACYIHPEVSIDLQSESGATGWLPPHQYSGANNIWTGDIGTYQGATYKETARCYQATDGSASTRVFRSYFVGQQALAEAVGEEFHTVVSPVVDKLKRFQPLAWYGLAGWAIYRQQAIVRVETTSSIHAT